MAKAKDTALKTLPRRQASAVKANALTLDSFQNFIAKLGIGTQNLSTASTYGFNPITRNRLELEWMYRGSWMVRVAVNCVADDMVRMGIERKGVIKPEDVQKMDAAYDKFRIWHFLNLTQKWSRLYGGAVAFMMIDGQRPDTPLRLDTVNKGQFKGLLVFDRWLLQPTFQYLVKEMGPNYGLPEFYETIYGPGIPKLRMHYSRVIRFEGLELPYIQKMAENMWGMSIVEPLLDRLVAFDSATQGASQSMYRSYLRTLTIPQLRTTIASGGEMLEGLKKQIEFMRLTQSNEGITVIDGEDKFETSTYSFAGVSETLLQFGQQLSGSLQIPLVRLFGQSPAGLNSTGESDLKIYYDGVHKDQELDMRTPVHTLEHVIARSEGINYPDDTTFTFKPLWMLSEGDKAEISSKVTTSVLSAESQGVIKKSTALKELKQSSTLTGLWTNITDEEIEEADLEPPPGTEEAIDGMLDPANTNEQLKKAANDSQYSVAGFDVYIETPKDYVRRGAWGQVKMPADYGFIKGTSSTEGKFEEMDCFVGDNLDSDTAYIINQAKKGKFDEHKVMLGYDDADAAWDVYARSYSGKPPMVKDIIPISLAKLKEWLAIGDVKMPYQGVSLV